MDIQLNSANIFFQIKSEISSTQPFYFFPPQGYNDNNDNWKESWVDTIYSIANDIKHVKVLLPAIHKEIHFESGISKIHNTKIRVEVLDPQPKFTRWTFFRSAFYQYNLDNNLNFSNQQLINLSRVLLKLFKMQYDNHTNNIKNNKKHKKGLANKKDENEKELEDTKNENIKITNYIYKNLVAHSSILSN